MSGVELVRAEDLLNDATQPQVLIGLGVITLVFTGAFVWVFLTSSPDERKAMRPMIALHAVMWVALLMVMAARL